MIAFETVFGDVMAARLTKRQEQASAPRPRSGLSRRGFLLGASSASGLAVGAMGRFGWLSSDPTITITHTADGLAIRAGGVTWQLKCLAFGPEARLSWQKAADGARIRISNASWPGLIGPFVLAIRLSPLIAGGFRLALRAPALGYRAASDWTRFVTGERADGRMSAGIALRLVRHLRLTKAMTPGGLGLAASGDWSLLERSEFGIPSALGTLGVRTGGLSELGRYAQGSGSSASTLVQIDQWRGALSGTARTRGEAGRIALEPAQIDRRVIEAFDGNQVIERTEGRWRIATQIDGRREIVCRGLVGALVRLRRGAAVDTAALLAFPNDGLKVASAAFHAHLAPGGLSDGLRWQTASGVLARGTLQGMLAKIDTRLAGADRATLSFVGQPVALHLAGPPRGVPEAPGAPAPPPVEILLTQKNGLRVPLDNAILHVVRGVDLVNIAFRFRNLHLAAGLDGARLLPTLKGKALQLAMAKECNTRPMIIAELPPQHVLERAFYERPSIFPNVRLDPWPPVNELGVPLNSWTKVEERKRAIDDDYRAFTEQFAKDYSLAYVPPDPPITGFPTQTVSSLSDVQATLNRMAKGTAIDDWRESRVSGKSRLSFTFPFDPHNRKRDITRARRGWKFALADLMAWDDLEPVVARRASNFDAASAKLQPPGKIKKAKGPDYLSALLDYHGVKSGDDRLARMTQVATLDQPKDYETAIEIPARLALSPDQLARFSSTRLPATAYRSGAVTPIWTTRMRVDEQGVRVRAIASPDYKADVYIRPGSDYPERGITSPWKSPQDPTFRTSMSPADRHELVALTSLIGLPILPAGPPNPSGAPLPAPEQAQATRLAATNVQPPEGYVLKGLSPVNQNVYVPDGMLVSELTLSGIHGSIAIDDHFQPPAAALLDDLTNGAFPALNVEAAHIRAVLGYDHDVAISYKGFLFPLGIPATLVKQTSRAVAVIGGVNVSYLEQRYYIKTASKVRVVPMQGQPFDGRDLPFSSLRPKGGNSPDIRDPYVDPPESLKPSQIADNGRIVLDIATPGVAFWPIDNTSPTNGPFKVLRFEVEADNRGAKLSVPLIFIDNTAAHDAPTLAALVRYYMHAIPMIAADGTTDPYAFLRFAEVGGASLTYALETAGGQCSFETRRFLLGVRSKTAVNTISACDATPPADGNRGYVMDSALEGMNQLPIYPYVVESHVGLANVQHFTGQPIKLTRIGYNETYVRYGFDGALNPNAYYVDVFGDLQDDRWLDPAPQPTILPIAGQGQRSGFAQPAMAIAHISRLKGPVGDNNPPKPPCEFKNSGAGGPPIVRIAARPAPRVQRASLLNTALAPAVKAPVPTVPPAPPSRVSPMQAFSSDATLLGLVKIWDVFKAALFAASPDLAQEMDDAADQVGEALDKLIGELQGYAQEVETGFHAADTWLNESLAEIKSITFAGHKIAEIYPAAVAACDDVGGKFASIEGDLAQLDAALGARDAAGVVKAAQRVYSDLSGLNDALTNLAAQMRRIATDPAPNLLDAAVSGMLSFIAGLNVLKTDIQQDVLAIRGLLDEALTDPEFEAYRAILLGPDCYEAGTAPTPPGKLHAKALPLSIDQLVKSETLTSTAKALGFQAYVQPALDTYDQFAALFKQSQASIGQLPAKAVALAGEILIALEAQLDPILLRGAFLQILASKPSDFTGLVQGLLVNEATSILRQSAFATPLNSVQLGIGTLLELERALANISGATHAKAIELAGLIKSYRVAIAAALAQLSVANGYIVGGLGQLNVVINNGNILTAQTAFTQAVTQIADGRRDAIAAARSLVTASKTAYQSVLLFTNTQELSKTFGDVESSMLGVVQAALALLSSSTSLSATDRSATYVPQAAPNTALGDLQHGLTDIGGAANTLERTRTDLINTFSTALGGKDISGALDRADQLSAQIVQFAQEQETAMLGWVASAITLPDSVIDSTKWQKLLSVMASIANHVAQAWQVAADALKSIADAIPNMGQPGFDTVTAFLSAFAPDLLKLRDLLEDADGLIASEANALGQLAKEIKSASTQDLATLQASVAKWRGQFDTLAQGRSNLQTTLALIASTTERLSKIHIDQTIDFSDLSRRLKQAVIAAIAPNLSLNYTLDSDLNDVGQFFSVNRDNSMGVSRVNAKTLPKDISIKFTSAMSSTGTPSFHIDSRIQPFIVNVFDIVKLYFAPGGFSGGSGESFDMDLKVAGFELGDAVSFLAELAPFLAIGGEGDAIKFLVLPSLAPVGIRAQLTIDLGTISLGEISFINVNFGASVLLPFENQPAQFTVSLASRDDPFLICCMPYGGGGFLSMTADTRSIVSFEASFEFGIVLAFSYGPLSAVGYVCTGIYVAKSGDGAEISAFFLASGSAHIACFGVSACLLVSMKSRGNNLTGSATFTFSFSLGLCDIKYSVGVAHQIAQWGGSGSGSSNQQARAQFTRSMHLPSALLATPPAFPPPGQHANAAGLKPKHKRRRTTRRAIPVMTNKARSMDTHWSTYKSYFRGDI